MFINNGPTTAVLLWRPVPSPGPIGVLAAGGDTPEAALSALTAAVREPIARVSPDARFAVATTSLRLPGEHGLQTFTAPTPSWMRELHEELKPLGTELPAFADAFATHRRALLGGHHVVLRAGPLEAVAHLQAEPEPGDLETLVLRHWLRVWTRSALVTTSGDAVTGRPSAPAIWAGAPPAYEAGDLGLWLARQYGPGTVASLRWKATGPAPSSGVLLAHDRVAALALARLGAALRCSVPATRTGTWELPDVGGAGRMQRGALGTYDAWAASRALTLAGTVFRPAAEQLLTDPERTLSGSVRGVALSLELRQVGPFARADLASRLLAVAPDGSLPPSPAALRAAIEQAGPDRKPLVHAPVDASAFLGERVFMAAVTWSGRPDTPCTANGPDLERAVRAAADLLAQGAVDGRPARRTAARWVSDNGTFLLAGRVPARPGATSSIHGVVGDHQVTLEVTRLR